MINVGFEYNDIPIVIECPNTIDRFYDVINGTKSFYELKYLEALLNNMSKLFNTSDLTFLDIGGCIGNHTVYFSKILGANVFTFEPNPISFSILERNVLQNKIQDKCTLFNNCVSHIPGKVKVLKSVDHMIGCTEWTHDNSGEIDSISLDEVIKDPIDFIKIDVEGMEIDVLKSAHNIIELYSPVIMIEISKISGVIIHQEEFDQWIIDNNYEYLYPDIFKHNTHLIRRCND